MKLRNAANSAWITLFQLDGEWTNIAFENGTAAAPSIYFKDSGTDTGIYSPGTDQVAITTGGTGRLFVDSSGRIGLGTSAPDIFSRSDAQIVGVSATGASDNMSLQLNAGASGTRGAQIYMGQGGTRHATLTSNVNETTIGTTSSTPLKFTTADSPRVTITSAGLVGIGTTSVNTTLEVQNSSTPIIRVGDGTRHMELRGGSTTQNAAIGTNYNSSFDIIQNGNAAVTIDSSKRVLVGTSSSIESSSKLQVKDGSLNIYHASAAAGAGYAILFTTDGSSSALAQAKIEALQESANTSGGRLVFSTSASGSGSPTERMRIQASGHTKISNAASYNDLNGPYHEFNNSASDWITYFRSSATNPSGIVIRYSGAAPNNTSSQFLYCFDTSVLRAEIRSNGGLANYSANNANLSDRNTKKDIAPAADTWDCLKEWEIVNYRYKDQPDDADLNLGVIAQQVAESCPEVITVFQEAKEATETEPAQEERLGVKEQQMMWMAIKALQEAQVRIETLEAEVAALKGA
jgi:hypothetical protein